VITTTYVTLYQHEQSEEGWATLDPLLEDVAPGHTVDRSLDYRRELAFDSPDDAAALGELLGRQSLFLVPCRTHTTVIGEPHCPDCGRALGEVVGYYWVSDAQVGGADLVSRNRNGMSLLFASRRLLELLAPASGLTTYDVMRVCHHR